MYGPVEKARQVARVVCRETYLNRCVKQTERFKAKLKTD